MTLASLKDEWLSFLFERLERVRYSNMDTLSEHMVGQIVDVKHGDVRYRKSIFTSHDLDELNTTRFIKTCCDCEGCIENIIMAATISGTSITSGSLLIEFRNLCLSNKSSIFCCCCCCCFCCRCCCCCFSIVLTCYGWVC